MPQSHRRHTSKRQDKPHATQPKKATRTAALFMGIMGAIFGLSFGYFTGDRSPLWSVLGGFIGAGLGLSFGAYMDRSAK